MPKRRAKRTRLSSQSFCERADVYCPPRERSQDNFGLQAFAVLALLYVGARWLGSGTGGGDARGGSGQLLKPPRKTQPGAAPATEASDGSAKQ